MQPLPLIFLVFVFYFIPNPLLVLIGVAWHHAKKRRRAITARRKKRRGDFLLGSHLGGTWYARSRFR
jgi:hypothetical protein